MATIKSIWGFIINHKHYWGIPHRRNPDGKLVMTCYECGREQIVTTNLLVSPALEESTTKF